MNIESIFDSFAHKYGFVHHAISSMNDAYEHGIPQIITNQFEIIHTFQEHMERNKMWTLMDKSLLYIQLNVKATRAVIHKPKSDGIPMFPNDATRMGKLYGGQLCVDFSVDLSAITKETFVKKNVPLGRVPIMVKSNRCNLEHMSRRELLMAREDPHEVGAHFVNGKLKQVIDCSEKANVMSHVNLYYVKGVKNLKDHLVRAQILSKPGIHYENNYQTELILKTTGEIVLNIDTAPFGGEHIPFYIITRLLSISDKDTFKYILYNKNDPLQKSIRRAFGIPNEKYKSLMFEHDPVKIKSQLAGLLTKDSGPRLRLEAEMFIFLDKYWLPHMGTNTHDKMLFLGIMIRKLFKVAKSPGLQIDRDSLSNKPIEAPGSSFANGFKTVYNETIRKYIIKKFKDKVNNTTFDNIDVNDIFEVVSKNNNMEKKLANLLNSGDVNFKNIRGSKFSTQRLEATSNLHQIDIKRTVRTHAGVGTKQAVRSNVIRYVHPTFWGFICIYKSTSTGENIGIVKSLACMCLITTKGNMSFISTLNADKDIIPLTAPISEFYQKGSVYFNGVLIGFTENVCLLREKYVKLRRARKIERFIGIHVHTIFNEIDFRVDDQRPTRPLLIVYNNIDNPEMFKEKYDRRTGKGFIQDIKPFNTSNIDDLVDDGILEWVDAKESAHSVLMADTYQTLEVHKTNPLQRYTHCCIPISTSGIGGITSPYANLNPAVRIQYHSKLGGQATGRPYLGQDHRLGDYWDQCINQQPVVSTKMNAHTSPCGVNILCAIMCLNGRTQEDAIIMNKRSIDRGLFMVVFSDILEYPLESNEIVGKPPTATDGVKVANYTKIKSGRVPPGIIIEKGDVILGKYIPIKGSADERFLDKSVVYKGKHAARVIFVEENINDECIKIVRIKIQYKREAKIGDKFSSRHGQKGIISTIYPHYMMPFSESGLVPDVIINPHAFPKRKTMGLLMEGCAGILAAKTGDMIDATIFTNVDVYKLLSELGPNKDRVVMYNGMTSERMATRIVLTPVYEQRIHLSIYDKPHSINKANRDVFTHQPTSGAKKGGGIRVSEMGTQVLGAHGVPRIIKNLFTTNSDGIVVYGCRCGQLLPIVNEKEQIYICPSCDKPDIVKLNSCYVSVLAHHILGSMDIKTNYGFT